MKRILILMTLGLLLLCFVKGSEGTEQEQDAVVELNEVIDSHLYQRVRTLSLGVELSTVVPAYEFSLSSTLLEASIGPVQDPYGVE